MRSIQKKIDINANKNFLCFFLYNIKKNMQEKRLFYNKINNLNIFLILLERGPCFARRKKKNGPSL